MMHFAANDQNLIFTMILLYRVKDYKTKDNENGFMLVNKVENDVILTKPNWYVKVCHLWFDEFIGISSIIFRFSGKVDKKLLEVAVAIENGSSIPDLLDD